MDWWKRIFGRASAERELELQFIREKFGLFRSILDRHNQVLKALSDLEEKAHGRFLADAGSIREDLFEIRTGAKEIIDRMLELGGEKYAPLAVRFAAINAEIDRIHFSEFTFEPDDFIIPFDRLGREKAHTVGGKNANLGEMKSRMGLPVPDGFAIGSWGYKRFVEANALQERISELIKGLRAKQADELELISEEIRAMIISRPAPDDMASAILEAFDLLAIQHPAGRFALRSSAIAEDSSFSFAGQYITFLNVRKEILLDCYREVLASKFTAEAIFYFLHHAMFVSDLAMGVACMVFVDSAAAGVAYSRDPMNPNGDYVLVNAVFGLGASLVDGDMSPDVFRVSRADGKVLESRIAKKDSRLVMMPQTGVDMEPVPESDQWKPSLPDDKLALLSQYAVQIEDHFGGPQDIEWALGRDGRLYVLQTRPLRMADCCRSQPAPESLRSALLMEGGTILCPGAGSGPIFHAASTAEMLDVPDGAVLVAGNASPKLISVMHKIAALVTLVGGAASHVATLAREVGVPAVAGLTAARELEAGRIVTVDASEGRIYDGRQQSLLDAREAERIPAETPAVSDAFRSILELITPLHLINPSGPDFTPENCRTVHDLTRYIHQATMEEMFKAAKSTRHKDYIGKRLKTDIPLIVNIVFLDREQGSERPGRTVAIDEVQSIPMKALWKGVQKEGWPQRPTSPDLKGFMAVVGTNLQQGNQPEFSENSYAFVSKEYMLLNLRMGYHFATIEALVTPEPSKNYIRMQFKEGGAPLERRIRRIKLICDLLAPMGFENASRGDFMDSILQYQDEGVMERCLFALGRINIMTKQLDMALSNDAVARWYTDEFLKKLGAA